jgi:metal-dependent hydrolase (beta-lactamase superfamily II)
VLSYTVEYDGGVALVDTGWPCKEAWDGLVDGLRVAGWDITDVKAVLITHGHGDHKGLAKRIRERTGAEVLSAHEYRFTGLAERARGLRKHHEKWLTEVMTALQAQPVRVTEAVLWSRPWRQMQGLQRRFTMGEAYAHLVTWSGLVTLPTRESTSTPGTRSVKAHPGWTDPLSRGLRTDPEVATL